MKIRSVTSYVAVQEEGFIADALVSQMKEFNNEVRDTFEQSKFELQSMRCATNPFSEYLAEFSIAEAVTTVQQIEGVLINSGFDYVSIGTVGVTHPELYSWIPEILSNTQNVFATAQMVSSGQPRISVTAIKAISKIMKNLSTVEANGFGNLYFAGLAQVPGGIPFLPAAYKASAEKGLSFALAMESADLAVEAFACSKTLDEALDRYRHRIEESAKTLEKIFVQIGHRHGLKFLGFDFTPAPFIINESSAGFAFENIIGCGFGEISSVSAAALVMSALDNANFKRSGFNGLMLPVLEDNILAIRVAEGKLSLKDLLLFSTVCGTGLDTIPLPGDISEEQLQAILLDVASLSVRLNKPLTARLMPIPGKKAGEMTSFDFPFFTNSRVMSPDCSGLSGLFYAADEVVLKPRF